MEVRDYIWPDKKYGVAGEERELWLWIVDNEDIHNGCYFCLDFNYMLEEDTIPEEVKSAVKKIHDLYPYESNMEFWVSW
jgi:hypothetical protein